MNGKCNLLKPVDSVTGTFFMFSQYSQDLTEAYTKQDTYRCVPSKSVCLNLILTEKHTAKYLGEIFQNYYENACARLRIEEDQWTPSYAAVLLWRTMEKFGLITKTTKTESGATMTYYPEVQHIDDINIYSYNQGEDGIGFNEVYCYVPNDAKKTFYPCEEQHYGSAYKNAEAYIVGWTGEPYNGLSYTTAWPDGDGTFSYEARGWVPSYVYSTNTSLTQERLSGTVAQDDEKFDINAVVVLYDIVSKTTDGESQIKYCNVPMGIYFTGTPNENELTNTIEKWVQHPDIYNQGTSWGLRICSRFMCVPNRVEFKSNETQTYNDLDDLTGVMSAFADSASLMNEAIVTNSQVLETLRSHLASFKNYQTNIPYIRPIGDENYWFINGKNTGVKVNSTIINNIYNQGTSETIPKAVDNGFIPGIFTGAEYGNMTSQYITLDNLQKFYNQLTKESGTVTTNSVIDLISQYCFQYGLTSINNQGTKLRFTKKNKTTDTYNDITIPIGVDYLNSTTFTQVNLNNANTAAGGMTAL